MDGQNQILIYQTASGKRPFEQWLANIQSKDLRAYIRSRITRLQVGHLGDCKSVGFGVLELRIHQGPGFRIYFALVSEMIVILLCAGDKSTQSKDIKKAKGYLKDYKERT